MRINLVVVTLLLASSVFADVYDGNVCRAMSHGAEFDMLFRIVDSDGSPVADAKCSGWMYIESAPEHGSRYLFRTDTNGYVRVGGRCGEWFSVVVRKEGYYRTMFEVKYPSRDEVSPIVDGKWQPYGVLRTIVLKKIKKPIEINRHSTLDLLKVPVYDKWIGFDFNRYSFVFPHGDGEQSDVQVCFTLVDTPELGYHAQMMLSFTNNPYAGAYLIKGDESSEFQSPYTADTNAFYQGHYVFSYDQDPNRPPKRNEIKDGEYFIFRTRTIVDHQGRLVSAHYGRLGGWEFVGPAGIRISKLVFNPTPNDTNLEDAETARKSRLAYKQQIEFERRRKAQGK